MQINFRLQQDDPVIIINLWTLSHNCTFNRLEKLLGFHLNTFQEEFEEFLKKLVDHGAKLLFVFKKNQYLEADFFAKAELEYKNSCEILNMIEVLEDFDSIVHHFEKPSKFYLPQNLQILLMMMQTAKKYGTIQGTESSGCKPSTAHARMANKMNTIAIIGLDTYYLFYEGAWKFWSEVDLDMKSMTILEYDKDVILKSLKVTIDQVPLFVVLAGGLYSSPENVMFMAKKFKFWDSNYFKRISAVVNEQVFPLSTLNIIKIVENTFGGPVNPKIVADFKKTLDLMNPDKQPDYPDGFDQNILKISDNELMNYASEILLNKSIFISPNYDDLR